MNRPFKKRYEVPIFGVHFWAILCDEIGPERQKMADVFGKCPEKDYSALCSYDQSDFGIFLSRRWMPDAVIAHEVFHATHRILEWCNCNFDPGHHEQGALLCGYLSELVKSAVLADEKSRKKQSRR